MRYLRFQVLIIVLVLLLTVVVVIVVIVIVVLLQDAQGLLVVRGRRRCWHNKSCREGSKDCGEQNLHVGIGLLRSRVDLLVSRQAVIIIDSDCVLLLDPLSWSANQKREGGG